jgi:hypothetical protein
MEIKEEREFTSVFKMNNKLQAKKNNNFFNPLRQFHSTIQ